MDGYILSNDIDFTGVTVTMADNFSGKILGNGYSLKNITLSITSRKVDMDKSKTIGLFNTLDGAYIENVTFENFNVKLKVNSGISVTAATVAIEAKNTQLKNVHFEGLTIDTGKGDDGEAAYKIGDVFVSGSNNKLDSVTGNNITITASESAQINSLLEQ